MHTSSCNVRMARRTQEIQPVQELLEQESEVQENRICVSNLKMTPDFRQEISIAQE
jgi:hypothetical protein